MSTDRERLNELRARKAAESPRQRLERLRALKAQQPTRTPTALPTAVAEGASALNRGATALPDFFVDAANTVLDFVNQNPALANAGTALLEPLVGKREEIPQVPRVQDSIQQAVPEFGAKNFMEPGLARTVVQEGGEFVPGVATAFTGGAPAVAKVTQRLADDAAVESAKTAANLRVGDKRSVGSAIDSAGEVVSDPAAKNAVFQGFDESVVAGVKASSEPTKKSMRRMVRLAEAGINRFTKTRPADEVGRVVSDRVSTIAKTNKDAGERLNVIAKGLSGKPVDTSQALTTFVDDLAEMGISVSDDLAKVSLKGSSIEDMAGAQETITLMLRRVRNTNGDALKAHRLKRFIDNRVDFDKSDRGLAGDLERVIKQLRRNIDQSLDSTYPAYKRVNDVFSETRGALDEFQKAAGTKLNLASPNANKQIGTLSRRLLSNAQSRAQLMDALDVVEEVAQKHGADVQEDLFALVRFGDDLDRVLKPAAPTSLRGEVAKGTAQAVREGATRAAVDKAIDVVSGKLTSKTEEEAIKSIKAVLNI